MKKIIFFISIFLCACTSGRVAVDAPSSPQSKVVKHAPAQVRAPAVCDLSLSKPCPPATSSQELSNPWVLIVFLFFLFAWWLIKVRPGTKSKTADQPNAPAHRSKSSKIHHKKAK